MAHRDVSPLPSRAELAHMISKTAQPGDYVICMGAGDITAYAYDLPSQLDDALAKTKGTAA